MIKSEKKLIIIRAQLVGHMAVFHPGIPIEIKFNPTEYSLEKRNTFSEATIPGLESPILQFSSGDSRTLSFELLIDTYAYDNGVDIRPKYIAKLESLMDVDGMFHAPRPVKFFGGVSNLSVCWKACLNVISCLKMMAHRLEHGSRYRLKNTFR